MNSTKKRVIITMELEIDEAAWDEAYGEAGTVEDVEDYVLALVSGCAAADTDHAMKCTAFRAEGAWRS